MVVRASVSEGDWIEIRLESSGEPVAVEARGCLELLTEAQRLRRQLTPNPEKWSLRDLEPRNASFHVHQLVVEVLLKAQGRWNFPFNEVELCHCRAIETREVDAAVLRGARLAETVTRMTSAGSACGTCKPDIEKILAFRRV